MTTNQSNRKLKILLVDDDPDTRQLVTMMLEPAGHKVMTTANGKAALTLLEHEKIDLILLDIMMPEIDGLNVLESLQNRWDIPVLMLTALSDVHIMQQSYQLGADDYIVKPFTRPRLLERIDRLAKTLPQPEKPFSAPWASRYQLNREKNVLVMDGTEIVLSLNEINLMEYFIENAYLEVTSEELYKIGWGGEMLPARTVNALVGNTVHQLQLKLEPNMELPTILVSTQNGFIFNP